MSAKKKEFRYVGDISLGERAPYVPGVPSRDLYEDDDADALKAATENSQTPNPLFVAVKHTSTSLSAGREEPAAAVRQAHRPEPVEGKKAKDSE